MILEFDVEVWTKLESLHVFMFDIRAVLDVMAFEYLLIRGREPGKLL